MKWVHWGIILAVIKQGWSGTSITTALYSPVEELGGNKTGRNRGSYARQYCDSGRAARSGGSHYLHISSVKLIVFTASAHEPTCHSNLACGSHSSVPAKCGKSGDLRQAQMLVDKETRWPPVFCFCNRAQQWSASEITWKHLEWRSQIWVGAEGGAKKNSMWF